MRTPGPRLTRDVWMHRTDITRATAQPPVLTPEPDGRPIADMVSDWTRPPVEPFRLVLTAPPAASSSKAARPPT